MAGDFNSIMLDFENNIKVQNLINLMLRYSVIPTINQPTQVTANTATVINHIINNVIIDTDFKTGILKSCSFCYHADLLDRREKNM